MTSAKFDLRHYIALETAVAVLVDIGFALTAAVLTFQGQQWIYVAGGTG